ncbi:E3 ubiquitin-protein ligase RFWD3 [Triticum aestivum]|uniref:E3 ubiquitin-protein ligase RFWD3 n=1 Tax=Triticum aestivum TaxID=4565 RepID=UPI001D029245|nr:E3 ubiquitin-protein ligase RFWD3-like [Triticum aestivum]
MERIVNKKVTMAKANLMLMKDRLKKMAEQEKIVPKDMIVFMEQNCPQLMICVSCVFSSLPAPGMVGGDEVANVEIVVREGPCPHTVEASEWGGRGNELNHTASGSGEETDDSYRGSIYLGEYNANISNMEASAEGREGVEAKAPARPTCSICLEPWTSTGKHHICCIPCGHVYGRSCLTRWLMDQLSRNENMKCPQCAEEFEGNLIDLHAPFCQEVHEYYDAKLAEFEASREECNVFAELHSQYDLLSAQAKFRDELRALIILEIAEIERAMMEHVAKANGSLLLMKEQMKKMAEEDMATTEHLIGFVEQTCHCLASFLPYPSYPYDPADQS